MLRTLLLSPPGFLDFDGGAGARYQNRREGVAGETDGAPLSWFKWFYHRDQKLSNHGFDAERLQTLWPVGPPPSASRSSAVTRSVARG
jgi:hypothetical protein